VRLHTSQVLLPAHVLAVDLAKVSDEECVFIADVADISVNGLYTALQRVANQLLWCFSAILLNTTQYLVIDRMVSAFERKLVFFSSSESRRCHALDGSSGVVDWVRCLVCGIPEGRYGGLKGAKLKLWAERGLSRDSSSTRGRTAAGPLCGSFWSS
jgi:hypothetical protein